MMQRYRFLFVFALFSVAGPAGLKAQEPETFILKDFQLRGPVKLCVVKANYGEERFEFDREGRLLKSLTRYDEADYDITYYRYRDGELVERRDEVYRDRQFDEQTSIAHFYTRDSLAPQLVERIVSYDRELQEQIAYHYNAEGRLTKWIRTRDEGVDETRVEYSRYKNESTATYRANGETLRSVRISASPGTGGMETELVKEYAAGVPRTALETTRDASGRTVRETEFEWDATKETFRPVLRREFTYDPAGFTSRIVETPLSDEAGAPEIRTREYIYQMDGKEPGNWIRQVITPENSIAVRQILYFEAEPGSE